MRCSDVLLCGSKSWVEAAGYLASLLVFATFCMKTMLPLRIGAILSNVAFIAYAFFDGLYPILILHSVLLPLNVVRTVQMLRVRRIVEQASKGEFTAEPLCPFMKAATWKAGEIIFRQGDYADRIYLLAKGSVRLNEIDLVLGAGELFGEIGVFSTAHERTQTAQAISDVELLWLTEGELAQVCHAHPALAFHFLKLSINRLLANTGRHLPAHTGRMQALESPAASAVRRMPNDASRPNTSPGWAATPPDLETSIVDLSAKTIG